MGRGGPVRKAVIAPRSLAGLEARARRAGTRESTRQVGVIRRVAHAGKPLKRAHGSTTTPLLSPLGHVGPAPPRLFLPAFRFTAGARPGRVLANSGPAVAAALAHALPRRDLHSARGRSRAHAATCRRSTRARVVGWIRPPRMVNPSALRTAATRAIDSPRPRMSRTRPSTACSGTSATRRPPSAR